MLFLFLLRQLILHVRTKEAQKINEHKSEAHIEKCIDLWSDLYAGVTAQFDAATTLIDSISTSLSLLSTDFQLLIQKLDVVVIEKEY